MPFDTIRIVFNPDATPAQVRHALHWLGSAIEDGTTAGFAVVVLRGPHDELVGAATFIPKGARE